MAVSIHPTAIVDPDATLDEDVTIGPYCVVSGGAFIGARTRLVSHVSVMGNVRLGHDNVLYPFCVMGGEPQDHGYNGAPTWVVIGDHNTFREGCTVHRGTTKEHGVTRIGSHNYLMCYCHIAHDVVMGSRITMANSCGIAGHVHIHDYAALSGQIGVHHYTTIGSFCFIGGLSRVTTDAPPYMLTEGNPTVVRCVNTVGLKRRGMSANDIQSLTEAHRLIYRVKMGAAQAKQILTSNNRMTEPVLNLFAFLENQHAGKHGRARERLRAA